MTFDIQEEGFRIRLDINQENGKTTISYNGKQIPFPPQSQTRADSRSIFHFQIGKGTEAQYYEIEYTCQSSKQVRTHRVTCKVNGTPFFYQGFNEKIL